MLKLLRDASLRNKLASRARLRVRQVYSMEAMGQRCFDLLLDEPWL